MTKVRLFFYFTTSHCLLFITKQILLIVLIFNVKIHFCCFSSFLSIIPFLYTRTTRGLFLLLLLYITFTNYFFFSYVSFKFCNTINDNMCLSTFYIEPIMQIFNFIQWDFQLVERRKHTKVPGLYLLKITDSSLPLR